MKDTFIELYTYLKNPVLEQDENTNFTYRIKKFGFLLAICIITGIAIMPLFAIIEQTGLVDMEQHAMEDLINKYPKYVIFLLAAVAAPLLEELIFRAPITAFKKKKNFKIAFYSFTIIFGLVHITNYSITENVILLAPILILPQLLVGSYFGFIRVRFGLIWSIALHGFYNGILTIAFLSTEFV